MHRQLYLDMLTHLTLAERAMACLISVSNDTAAMIQIRAAYGEIRDECSDLVICKFGPAIRGPANSKPEK